MKLALILSVLSFNVHAGELSLFCDKRESPSSCGLLAELALVNLGCAVTTQKTDCKYTLVEDPKNPGKTIQGDSPYCELTSSNCSRPNVGNFGGESCFEGKKVTLSKEFRVHNGYWFGWFGSYSRTVCFKR